MKAKDTALAADLVSALKMLPKVRRGLLEKPKNYDGIVLEIQAAEISDGETQGAEYYFHVPPSLAGPHGKFSDVGNVAKSESAPTAHRGTHPSSPPRRSHLDNSTLTRRRKTKWQPPIPA